MTRQPQQSCDDQHLHRHCDQLQRMVTHHKEYIKEKGLKEEFFLWLTQRLENEGMNNK